MSAALHPASVLFLCLLPVAVLLLRLGRKCADSVSGKAFFFFEIHGYSSGSPGRQVTVGAEERLPSRLCARPAGDSSACVTKTPWRIPTWWRAHQTRASDWFLVKCESALRSDNRLRGHIPQTKCLLCSARCNLGDAPMKRLQHKTHDKFFLIWQTILSCRAVLVWCQWVRKKIKNTWRTLMISGKWFSLTSEEQKTHKVQSDDLKWHTSLHLNFLLTLQKHPVTIECRPSWLQL